MKLGTRFSIQNSRPFKSVYWHTGMESSIASVFFFLSFVICFLSCPALGSEIRAELVASGLSNPLYAVSPPNDFERLFIVEQHTGRIKILNLNAGVVNTEPFLDIDGLAAGNEQGLLGLAFSPEYAVNGLFYVNFTQSNGTTNIRRYSVSVNNPDIADAASGTTIMTYSQPFSNHNGGWLGFGPDGYLYICTGDGGSGNDPGNRAQDITNQRLGKILRIDINSDDFPADSTRNYAIPPDNPFVGTAGDDEIWAYGLRNPWRASFDRLTGDLYIADVGQNQREEINFQPATSRGGENYGWRVMEGTRCNFSNDPLPCNDPSFTSPIHDYPHTSGPDGGYSITGGYVYRGPIYQLQGTYFFADYVSGQVWSFRYDGTLIMEFVNRTAELTSGADSVGSISSFGEDAAGNLYIVDLGGQIFKIVCGVAGKGDFDDDCDIDFTDFALFASAWLSASDKGQQNGLYDIFEPQDGVVNMLDLQVLMSNWLSDFRLAARWRLDEAEGDVAGDSFGGHDGMVYGNPSWRPSGGALFGALEFDGIDDYIEVPFVLNPADGPFSAYAWIKTDVPGRTILSQAGGGGAGASWLATEPADGKLMTGLLSGSPGRNVAAELVSETAITDDLWHHIGFVWDGSVRRLYVDGAEVARDEDSITSLRSSGGDFYIGAGETLDTASFFSGLIDDVRIYGQAVEL